MGAANQDQQRAAVRTALIFGQVLSPSGAHGTTAAFVKQLLLAGGEALL
jgi:hypothetical protein